MESSEKDLRRKIEDISLVEKIKGLKNATQDQRLAFLRAVYWFDRAESSAIKGNYDGANICLKQAAEHASISGINFESRYSEIKKYFPKAS